MQMWIASLVAWKSARSRKCSFICRCKNLCCSNKHVRNGDFSVIAGISTDWIYFLTAFNKVWLLVWSVSKAGNVKKIFQIKILVLVVIFFYVTWSNTLRKSHSVSSCWIAVSDLPRRALIPPVPQNTKHVINTIYQTKDWKRIFESCFVLEIWKVYSLLLLSSLLFSLIFLCVLFHTKLSSFFGYS